MVRKLRNTLDSLPGLDLRYVLVEDQDYQKYPAPWWAKTTNPWHAQYLARQKVNAQGPLDFDIVLFNAWELVVCFEDFARKAVAGAILDAVPSTFDVQLRGRGLGGWKRGLSHALHHRAFKRAARQIDLFMPMGSDCSDALQQGYGVSPEKCMAPTLSPQDLDGTRPDPRNYAPPLRLLFVGKEFFRKGGEFLLRLHAERLSKICKLTIVSSDPGLDGRHLPAGVEKLSSLSLEDLFAVYRRSHVFVFPTQQDFLPQVLAEAIAFGLPCMASDVGAVRDLVNDQTGFLMSRDASIDDWASRIERLASDPLEMERLSRSAREFAEENLSPGRFRDLWESALHRLTAGAKGSAAE